MTVARLPYTRGMRACVVVVLAIGCLASRAAADGPHGQVSVGVATGALDRTTTYDSLESPDSATRMKDTGLGVQLGVTAGYDLGEVRVGGFTRWSRYAMDTTVETWLIGPAITWTHAHGVFARGELGVGTVDAQYDASYTLHSDFPTSLLHVGAEVGYDHALAAAWHVQPAFAFASVWNRTSEDGDTGTYRDRSTLYSIALVVSIAYTPR